MPSPSLGWFDEGSATRIRPVCWAGGNCGPVIYAWGGGAYDSLRNRLIIWGGGHTDYGGNELYAVNFNGIPNAQRLTDNTAGCNSIPSCDGGLTPNSRHTYDLLTYCANIDAFLSYGGALSGDGYSQNDLWMYHFSTQTWERRFFTGPSPVSGVSPVCYDSVTNYVYIWDNRSLYRYDPAANHMTTIFFNENGYLSGNTSGALDPVRRKIWVLTGTSQLGKIDISEVGAPTTDVRAAVTPTGDTAWLSLGMVGIAYHPPTTHLFIWAGGNTVYEYNPDTNVSTAITGYTGGPNATAEPHGTYGRWDYSTTSGVFFIVNSVDENAFTFRVGASVPDTQAPTAPTNPSATAISGSQINLSWTASTDNIAVTGYLIERCAGAACSSFSQIDTTASTSYSNIGLTSGTLYRYRIRATDAAGNLSAYSSTVEATTATADTEPPTTPTGLTATTISYNQINLSWTASTDNIGVVGYRVERCAGASCTGFVQVAAPIGTTLNDIGLSSSTTYRYRVRAVDAANNFSGYSSIVNATTLDANISIVGGGTYPTWTAAIAAAVDGDIIEGPAGIYPNESFTWTQQNLTMRGLGGYAHLKWDTGDYQTATTVIPNGQAIIKMLGSGTIENFEFSGANVADNNGAGIRYAGGDFYVNHCYFHDNEQGILGQGGPGHTLTIEYSIAERNGQCVAGDCAHNFYIGAMGKLVFRFNKSVNVRDGHCLKSRATRNFIIANHFSTKDSNGSYELEFPNGHTAYVVGNVMEQGDGSDNSTMLSYGAEGLTSPTVDVNHFLYVNNNTFYNWRSAGCIFIQLVGTPTIAQIVNNARSIGGTWLSGTATTLTDSNNVALADGDWANVNTADFHLKATSLTAINAGTNPGVSADAEVFNLIPSYEYVDPGNKTDRLLVGVLDVGAYEFGTPTGISPIAVVIRIGTLR